MIATKPPHVYITLYMLLQAWEEQFPHEKGYRTASCKLFKFKIEKDTEPHIKIVVPQQVGHCMIVLEPLRAEVYSLMAYNTINIPDHIILQIKESDIQFNDNLEVMQLKHKQGIYPPRVKMTVVMDKPDTIILPVEVMGCLSEGQLNMKLILPLTGSYLSVHVLTRIKGAC